MQNVCCMRSHALYSALAVLEPRPFGWEIVERDGGEWLRKASDVFVAEFRADAHAKPWQVRDTANNTVLLKGDATLSLLRMCRVLEAIIGVLTHRSTSEIPMQ
jgi:hypothetical protein